MSLKIKKNIPLIDQHDKNFMYGGKFGGNYIPETLKKPIDDLTKLFSRLRKNKKFLRERDHYFKTYVGAPTPFIKLDNLTDHLGVLKFMQKLYLKLMAELTKFIMLLFTVLSQKEQAKNMLLVTLELAMQEKCFLWQPKNLALNAKYLWVLKILKDKGPT